MNKATLLLISLIIFSNPAANAGGDWPVPFDGRSLAKLKGPVHTVLTIKQRGEKVFGTSVEVYDLKGRLMESLSSNASIEIHSGTMVRLGGKSTYSYDATGNLLRENHFSPEGQPSSYETYAYDSQNRQIENITYSLNGKEFERISYKYFSERLELEMTRKIDYGDGNKHSARYLIKLNEKAQGTRWAEYDLKGSLSPEYISFEYDDEGNVKKEEHCCRYKYAHRFSYKFDRYGNWVEQQNTYLEPGNEEKTNPDWMYQYRIITYYSDTQQKP